MLIFNMVSEPNFVLGIKQKFLASKEDSHVHITIRSHICLSAGSRLHSILQPPWLTTVSRSSSLSNPCLSLSDLCISSLRLSKPIHRRAPRHPPRKTQKFGQPKSSHAPPRTADSFEKSLTRCLRFLTSDRLIGTRAALKASTSTDLQNLRTRPSSDLTRALTRL